MSRFRPKRALGQNFLVDRGIRDRILEALAVEEGDTVLEIGPGSGALTGGLARKVGRAGARLVLVELDDDLAEGWVRTFADDPRVEVLHRDILDVAMEEIAPGPRGLTVIGNIPYNITTPILFHLLERPRPREIILMVQREVADRILAPAGGGSYGALSVGVRSVADVEAVLPVPASAFRPRPKVDSTVIRLRPHDPSRLDEIEEARLRDLTRALFQWRRKQLRKILRDHPALGLDAVEIEEVLLAGGARRTDRPETVDPRGFVAMARAMPVRGHSDPP
ncbi:MAG: 16S rRNA (adenine(1518)-N(6)/adenine(1519)-N(6))-dimethyltransferase RsmA [Gemmatimonadota bacterium]